MRKRFLELANRIHLSPKESVLEECSEFLKETEEDLNLLKRIDTSNVPIHYSCRRIAVDYNDLSQVSSHGCENEHLVKSLVKNYAISDIKKSS